MNISKFDYQLDKSFIAREPANPRDSSKLLILDKQTGNISHKIFHDLADILTANDILVFNETKVSPSKIIGKKETGGKVEILLLKQLKNNIWECLAKNLGSAPKIYFAENQVAEVLSKSGKIAQVKIDVSRVKLEMPVPPYIDYKGPQNLKMTYNTVYARESGSVAAPTAGLHFTNSLLKRLSERGIHFAKLTLHVGMGTFEPVQTQDLTKHKIHSEYYEISDRVAQYLNREKSKGKRIIAVGTTTTRVLETLATDHGLLNTDRLKGDTRLFIYPPYKFKFVDCLITNFHLPKSTLLSLVSAFVDNKPFTESKLEKAYDEAIKNNYRFYSFGDAMLVI